MTKQQLEGQLWQARELAETRLKLIQDLWRFIENVPEDAPDRTAQFFALRERVWESA